MDGWMGAVVSEVVCVQLFNLLASYLSLGRRAISVLR